MTRKMLLTSGLLVFVAVSLTLAVADVAGWRSNPALPLPTESVSTTSDKLNAE